MINPDTPLALLGNLSPNAFMRTYWQRKPLFIRQAIANFKPPMTPTAVRRLARHDDVESRLIWREYEQWHMDSGPFARLPQANKPNWTLLVQGVDLHDDATAKLMHRFRFIADARLDDAMISIAGNGGGVGPHFDSYDVFLLQASGKRRWRISQQTDLSLEDDVPLKILKNFQPEEEYLLEAGDMLYLPPHVAHDGVAEGDGCMTISIGFRAPSYAELAQGMLDAAIEAIHGGHQAHRLRKRFQDPGTAATTTPALLPESLIEEAVNAVSNVKLNRALAIRFLGAWLTEPKPHVVFDAAEDDHELLVDQWPTSGCIELDRRTRMLYFERQGFINGEPIQGRMSATLKRLADDRRLVCTQMPKDADRERLEDWRQAGWLHHRS